MTSLCHDDKIIVNPRFIYEEFDFQRSYALKKFENKTPLKITYYAVALSSVTIWSFFKIQY